MDRRYINSLDFMIEKERIMYVDC